MENIKLAQAMVEFVEMTGEVIKRFQNQEKRAQISEMQTRSLQAELYDRMLRSNEIVAGAEKEAQLRLSTHFGTLTLLKQALDLRDEQRREAGDKLGGPSQLEKEAGSQENAYACFANLLEQTWNR